MSRKNIEPPFTEKVGDALVTTHPAFGQIQVNRVNGVKSLYGSDFRHNGFMEITVRTSTLNRSLSNDWHFGQDLILAVALSESQWAAFVSSPNVGTGVPCTIQFRDGKSVPGLPDPESRVEQFKMEASEKLESVLSELRTLLADIDTMGLSKFRAATMKARVTRAIMQLSSNLPFVGKSFGEYAEDVVEKAKAEIHGYMTGVVQRAGIAALRGQPHPISIEFKEKSDD
jgi:hypothetical protein